MAEHFVVSDMESKEVTLFREYLRLKTVQPEPNYGIYSCTQDVA